MSRDDRYRQLAEAYGAMITRLARGYERDADKARDLVQTIHVELWRSLASFENQCSDSSWVHRIAHNVGVSHMIREARANRPDWAGIEELAQVAGGDCPEKALDQAQRQARLLTLIHRLRPADRQIVLLTLEDLTAAEIADVTGLSANVVAVRLHRAKALLAALAGDFR
jgi:RNA polymerase sigma-70 factor (ECF subfamily)